MAWGYHLILNCKDCDRAAISSAACLEVWLADLLARIQMVPVGDPWIMPSGQHDDALAGLTLMQCIETSSITGHFCDGTGEAYIDIFSCKDFNTADAEDCVRKHLRPSHIGRVFLERQA